MVDTFDDVVDAGDTFTSLREAITQAADNDGDDTILLPGGTYSLLLGELAIDDDSGPLTIQSDGGPATVDAQGDSRVFSVAAGSVVTLEGLTITGGSAPDLNTGSGAGIWNKGIVTVADCILRGNTAGFIGGGLFNDLGTATVTDTLFDGNTATFGGGLSNNSAMTVTGGEFLNNLATQGAGGVDNIGTISVSGTLFKDNTGINFGGGLHSFGGFVGFPGTTEVSDCVFQNNSSPSGFGGGLEFNTTTVTITGCTIEGNPAGNSGGGISMFQVTATVDGCTFEGNTAAVFGGGISAGSSTLSVTESSFEGNTSSDTGGGISSNGILTVTGGLFLNNTASSIGGGLANAGTVTIANSTFEGNSGFGGGGGITSGGTVTIADSTFEGNSAPNGRGGAILNGNSLTLSGSTLTGNSAFDGGGIVNFNSTTITGSIFESNTATFLGGGIASFGIVTVTDGTFQGNSAPNGGGIYNSGSFGSFTNNIITGNIGDGVRIDGGSNNTIGTPDAGNTITGNTGAGVAVVNFGASNAIRGNVLNANGGLAIDLGGDGRTANDVGDGDGGPNQFQNFPVITGFSTGATTHVTGTLNSTPNTSFTIDVFADAGAAPINPGESVRYLGSINVTTDEFGNASFDETLDVPTSAGESVSATATDPFGNTSEFSFLNLIVVTPTSGLFTSESGVQAGFSVVLTVQPTANVTIPLSSSDPSEGSVSPASLTFTPANWNVPKVVTVTGVNDSIADGPIGYSIVTGPATSADARFDGTDTDDVQVTNFDNDFATTEAISPAGSLIYSTVLEGRVATSSGVESYSLLVDPGQKITVVVDPVGTDLKPTIQLFRVDGGPVLIGSATAGAAGGEAVVQTVATHGQLGASGPKTYQIRVTGAAGTTGFYSVRVILNAAVENESHGGVANNTRATAQSLQPSVLPLNAAVTAVPSGTYPGRGAVLGRTEFAITTVFAADFESGNQGFTVDNAPPNDFYRDGLWHLSTGRGAQPGHSAGQSFYYGQGEGPDGGGSINVGATRDNPNPTTGSITTPSIALPTGGNLLLDFHYVLQTRGFPGFVDFARLEINDGSGWTLLQNYDRVAESLEWRTSDPVDISAYAGQTVHLRWSFDTVLGPVGRFPEGWYIDDVRIVRQSPTPDYYAFTLAAGESATLALSGLSVGDLTLALENSAGTTLATGRTSATNVDAVINNFVATTAGTYYARLIGTNVAGTDYSLVVTRNAEFDTEGNDSLETAQDLISLETGGRRWVLGALGGGEGGDGGNGTTFLPTDLFDSSGFRWDIQGDGSIGDGTSDAFDGGHVHLGFPNFGDALTEGDGREIVVGPIAFGDVTVSRKIFVPADETFARFLEIVTNTGTTAVTYTVPIFTNLGSDGGESFVSTSSGDSLFDNGDDWIITDDFDFGGDPTVLHVIAGAGGMRPTTAGFSPGSLSYSYDLTLNPGETKVIMHFGSQNPDQATALARAPELAGLGLNALAGMSADEQSAVVNFNLGGFSADDFYRITANANAMIEIETQTPASKAGEFTNDLDPIVYLYDQAGNLVASNDNGAPDGRNAKLSYKVPKNQGGTYFIQVSASPATPEPTRGEYLLSVKQATGALPAFRVTATDPPEGARFRFAPDSIRVDFNDVILLTTLQASDLTVDGVPVANVTIVDGDTLIFALPGGLTDGTHTVAIAAGAIKDVQGTSLAAFTGHFVVDQTPPRVVATSIQENDVLPPGSITYTVQFSEPMQTANFDSGDFQLVGLFRGGIYGPATFSFDPAGTTLTIAYDELPDDRYTLTLFSGDFAFEDLVGNDLDGEPVASPIPPNQSGDGIEGGNFFVDFVLDEGTLGLPTPLVSVAPAGSLIYQSPSAPTGTIAFDGDTDDFTITLDAGQTITVLVTPGGGLQATIEVRDPSNAPIGVMATAPGAGIEAVFQATATTGAGTYTVTVGGAGGTLGLYSVRVILNAAVEDEAHGGSANDDLATAQDIGSSFVDLGPGASRGAVLGLSFGEGDFYAFHLDAGQSATLALTGLGGGNVDLSLFAPDGAPLALGVAGATNVAELIDTLIATASGTYYVKVVGDFGVGYSLVVTRYVDFDAEDNDEFASAQDISGSQGALGHLGGRAVLYGSSRFGELFTIDVATGAGTFVGFLPIGTTEIEYSSVTGRAFAQAPDGGFFGVEFDITTGAGLSGGIFNGGSFTGLEYVGSTLYGTVIFGSGGSSQLRTLDPLTGASTFIGFTGFGPISGLAYDETTGVMYGITGGSGPASLLTIDVTTGAATVVGSTGFQAGSLELGPDGDLYGGGTGFSSGLFYRIDPTTGAGTLVGSTGFALVTGLTLFDQSDPDDWYSISVAAGDNLDLATITPSDGPGEFVNLLDPHIELYDPTGALVASGTPLADGRNEQLTHTAPATGQYRIRVTSNGGSVGEYALSVQGATGAQSAFQVTSSNPADGARVRGPVTQMIVDLNDTILITSLQASDLTIDGVPATDVTFVDGDTAIFTLPGGLSEGSHTVDIAAGAIQDLQGTSIAAFATSFYNDITAPTVVATSIQPAEPLSAGETFTVVITFSEPMNTANLDLSDSYVLGQFLGAFANPSNASYDATGTVLTLEFAGLTDDLYNLVLVSGDFAFEDIVGFDLDGDGDGFEGGAFVLPIAVDAGTQALAVPLVPINPLGSLIYRSPSPAIGTVVFDGDADDFTIDVDPGQTITVLVAPSSDLQAAVEVLGPDGLPIGSDTGDVAGGFAIVQTAPANSAGTYTVRLGGAGGSLGRYSIQLFLNAALEEETYGGPTDDDPSPGSAQPIDAGFIALPDGAARGAVLGRTAVTGGTIVEVEPNNGPSTDPSAVQNVDGGSWSLDSDPNIFDSTTQPHISIVGTGDETFDYYSFTVSNAGDLGIFDIDFANYDTFLYLYDSAGNLLAVNDDSGSDPGGGGLNSLIFYTFGAPGTYIVAVGRFPFGNPVPSGGLYTLQMSIQNHPLVPSGAPFDYYSFTLADNQAATIALTSLTGGNVDLALLDSTGTVIATGIGGATNVDEWIRFADGEGATYYVQVSGGSGVDYSLVVTRDAEFDIENNSSRATAQTIDLADGTATVLGFVGPRSLVIQAFDSGWYASDGFHNPANRNYFTGGSPAFELRSFFTFDLSGLASSDTVVSARLEVFNPVYEGFDPFENYTVYDVTTPIGSLVGGGSGLVGTFDDLGGGNVYGTRDVFPSEAFSLIRINLNADAVAAINAASGLQFAVGGALTTIDRTVAYTQAIFSFSNDPNYTRQLVLGLTESDFYRIELTTDRVLDLSTTTPSDGPGEFDNTLDPLIRVYDADGNLVASDDNSAPDGRNALLSGLDLTAGTYFIEVVSFGDTRGEYTLSVSAADGFAGLVASAGIRAPVTAPVTTATKTTPTTPPAPLLVSSAPAGPPTDPIDPIVPLDATATGSTPTIRSSGRRQDYLTAVDMALAEHGASRLVPALAPTGRRRRKS